MRLRFLNSFVEDGNMCENIEPGVGKKNSEIFFKNNNISIDNTIYLNVKDNNIIKEYESSKVETKPYNIPNMDADAIITKTENLFLYQKFGDCVPFTVYDKKQSILVFAHIGIHSAIKKLHIEIINKLVSEYNCKIEDLMCYLGPSIKKESYLKKLDDNQIFNEWNKFLEKKNNGMYSVDLQGFIVHGLINMNISKDNIEVSDIDTAKDERYFSHYRSKNDPNLKEQRFIYGVMMIDN